MQSLRETIPKDVLEVIEKLHKSNRQAYLVGGACRNFLLGNPSTDFDVTTDATPLEVMSIIPNSECVGSSFPVTMCGDIEIATYRKDLGDTAETVLTLEEDVIRRDFTINAIAYDVTDGSFIDHVGGLYDIRNKILRFVGNPDTRIIEDPIRMLRGIRFASQFDLTIELLTRTAIKEHRELLKTIPAERIQQEVVKAFKTNHAYDFLITLEKLGLLDYIFPSLQLLRNQDGGHYHNETVLVHVLGAVKAIDGISNYKLKLSALYHDIGKYTHVKAEDGKITFKGHNVAGIHLLEEDLRNHLKFSNDVVEYVKALTLLHMDSIDSRKSIRKLNAKLYHKGIDIRDFVLLRYADNKGNLLTETDFRDTWKKYKDCLQALNEKTPFSVKDIAVSGETVMERFNLQPCRRVGELLQVAFEAVLNEVIGNDHDEIMEYLHGYEAGELV